MLTLRTPRRRDGAGAGRAARRPPTRPIRWVHITELPDPTPWLSGGELLLTTGLQLHERRSASASSCGGSPTTTWPASGFGTGFEHDDDARRRWSTRRDALGFPLFEVPYELPFIAHHREGVRAARERAVRGAAARDRASTSGSSGWCSRSAACDEVVRALSAAIGGAVWCSTRRGETMAAASFRRDAARRARWTSIARRGRASAAAAAGRAGSSSRPTTPSWPGARWRCRWPRAAAGAPQAWLVAVARRGRARRLRAADPAAGGRRWWRSS